MYNDITTLKLFISFHCVMQLCDCDCDICNFFVTGVTITYNVILNPLPKSKIKKSRNQNQKIKISQ